AVLHGAVAGDAAEAEAVERGDGVAGGEGAVVAVLAPEEERFALGLGEEEPAAVGVGEAALGLAVEGEGGLEVALVEEGVVELVEAPGEAGVVVEEAGDGGLAGAVAVEEAAVGRAHRLKQEVGGAGGGLGVAAVAEGAGGAGQRGDHEPVPVREHLVVEARARALVAGGDEALAE